MQIPEPLSITDVPRSNAADFSVGAVLGRALAIAETTTDPRIAEEVADLHLSAADEDRLGELCRRSQAGTIRGMSRGSLRPSSLRSAATRFGG